MPIMMATKAYSGGIPPMDISMSTPDWCWVKPNETYIHPEYGECYVGNWIYGIGFYAVKFPKSTTRPCTPEEKAKFLNGRTGYTFGPTYSNSEVYSDEDFA